MGVARSGFYCTSSARCRMHIESGTGEEVSVRSAGASQTPPCSTPARPWSTRPFAGADRGATLQTLRFFSPLSGVCGGCESVSNG
mmetsp:Transcript_3747/g.11035  ORF Transcript_3747/g.11035 Transcript_3747/m.11035 type:complete len:85 (-) Transcript_3747:26-280(-)